MDRSHAPLPAYLAELSQRLAKAEDLHEGAEAIAWACDGFFPFYRVSVVLPARAVDRCFVAAAWARRPEEELEGFDFSVAGHPLEPVLLDGETVVRTHPLTDDGPDALARLYRGEDKREEMAVPLDLGWRRGMLVFASREANGFDARARGRARDVARLAALWARPWAGPDAPLALKEQYETLLEGALDGIAVIGGDRIRYANASFREIFGLDEGAVEGRGFTELLAPESRDGLRDALAGLDRRSRVLPRLEVEAAGPRGGWLYLDVGLQRVWFQGEPSVLVQVHNASARAERERRALSLYEQVDGVLHTLAHDIRAPLTTVIGFSELLMERLGSLPGPRVREMLGLIARSGRTLKDLVEGLLDYSGLGRREAPLQTVVLEPLVRSVETELEGLIADTGARILYRALPDEVLGRPVEVGRVFRNLIENALRYRRPDRAPEVVVSCGEREGRFHVFCVADNGVGIDPEQIEGVFELFQRGEHGGAGVGLAIVERIVRVHGGRVWVESEPGQGSRFYFTLPAVDEAP